MTPDRANCLRNWNIGKDSNGFDQTLRDVSELAVSVVVIQFNYGFYNHFELQSFIEECVERGVAVLIDLHATIDPQDADNWRLADFRHGLRQCHRILVHSLVDMERLKALGLVENVTLFPLGVMNRVNELAALHRHNTPPLIASFGFCLPNKGLAELVDAVGILKRQGVAVRLRMLNAEYPVSVSAHEVQKVRDAIARNGLEAEVEFRTEFLADEVCLSLLAEADLVVNPYQKTGESASASVRYGLSAGRPVAVTPLPFFDDLQEAVFRLPGITPELMAEGIADALQHIGNDTETARRVRAAAAAWIGGHDYARLGACLLRMVRALTMAPKPARPFLLHAVAKPLCPADP